MKSIQLKTRERIIGTLWFQSNDPRHSLMFKKNVSIVFPSSSRGYMPTKTDFDAPFIGLSVSYDFETQSIILPMEPAEPKISLDKL